METNGTFAENVLLLDTMFLNETAYRLKKTLETRLGRTLPEIDLPEWLTCLALDAGIRGGENEIQVLLLHDDSARGMAGCQPSDWEELDGRACRTAVGELSFTCVTPSNIASRRALFLDLTTLALDAATVKRLLLLPHHLEYGEQVGETLKKCTRENPDAPLSKVLLFSLQATEAEAPYRHEPVHYSLLHAWNIRPEEL